MLSTLGAKGEVAGVGRGGASLVCLGGPTRLYRLLCELRTRGRLLDGTGGTSLVLPLRLGKLLLDLDFCEESVVGGEDLSSHELNVEEDLFGRGRSGASPSLLDVLPDCEPSVPVPFVPLVLKLFLERRRMLRSLRKDGIGAEGVCRSYLGVIRSRSFRGEWRWCSGWGGAVRWWTTSNCKLQIAGKVWQIWQDVVGRWNELWISQVGTAQHAITTHQG